MCALVGSCGSTVVVVVGGGASSSIVGCCAAVVVGSGVATCGSSLLLSAMRLSAVVSSCSSCSSRVGGGESTGIGGGWDNRGDAGTTDVVGDEAGLGGNGGCCYGEEHALVGASAKSKEEGLAAWVGLALGCTVGGSV